MDAPKCRLCQRNHWQSVACNGIPHAEQRKPKGAENAKAGERPSGSPKVKHPAVATRKPAKKKAKRRTKP
jgi:hypothetical protein